MKHLTKYPPLKFAEIPQTALLFGLINTGCRKSSMEQNKKECLNDQDMEKRSIFIDFALSSHFCKKNNSSVMFSMKK